MGPEQLNARRQNPETPAQGADKFVAVGVWFTQWHRLGYHD